MQASVTDISRLFWHGRWLGERWLDTGLAVARIARCLPCLRSSLESLRVDPASKVIEHRENQTLTEIQGAAQRPKVGSQGERRRINTTCNKPRPKPGPRAHPPTQFESTQSESTQSDDPTLLSRSNFVCREASRLNAHALFPSDSICASAPRPESLRMPAFSFHFVSLNSSPWRVRTNRSSTVNLQTGTAR
jgi:hypothetical protein